MRIFSRSLFALSLLFSSAAAMANGGSLVPPDEPISGTSQEDWSRTWWQWAASFDQDESPVADRTGEFCGSRQSGPVWFLAGTYGTQRTIRTCRVPKDKYLFFPLINYVVTRGGRGTLSCDDVKGTAARMTDGVSALVLEVDGVRHEGLEKHRMVVRECFDLGARTPERFRIYPAAANGYYVMLKPLPPGRHTLNFGGALPSSLQAVTYTLIVE